MVRPTAVARAKNTRISGAIMSSLAREENPEFQEALRALRGGSFDASAPWFGTGTEVAVDRPRIIEWYDQGLFGDQPQALPEALSCACFLEAASRFRVH
jgi:hypothetical protein